MPQFPFQWTGKADDENPFFGLLFDPMLCNSDGQDGCLRQVAGSGPYKTNDKIEIAWCNDDFISTFLEDLRNNKDAIKIAAQTVANPLLPKWQDGHGWSPVYPTDDPQYGPLINPRYKSYATERLDHIREELSVQGENFLTDFGISKQAMLTNTPDHYRNLAPNHPAAPVGAQEAYVHNTMSQAYKQFRDIEAHSVWAVSCQHCACYSQYHSCNGI